MERLGEYVVLLSGAAIIFLAICWDLIGFGSPGFGMPQIIMISVGIVICIAGLMLRFMPAFRLKKRLDVNTRTLIYQIVITVVLFVCIDLLLGQIYPKIYAPTKYGWSVTADNKIIHTVQDTKNIYREVSNQYVAHGFKRWPKNPGTKPRVLIIGDSFTEMTYVSNGEEWYAYLERAFPDFAFYVFGAAGYGTLQEYMVMVDYFDEIHPNAIIWQFCDNDYANNYYAFDRQDYPFNNHCVRPYWEHNEIVYRLPLPYPLLREYSFTADRLLHLYDKKRWRDSTRNISEYLKRRDAKRNNVSLQKKQAMEQMKKNAVAVTRVLAKKIRSRSGDMPIYFFKSNSKLNDDDRSVCEAGGFRCVDISDSLRKVEDDGVQIKVENGRHWNCNGNQYAGKKLVDYFKAVGGMVPGN